MKPLLCLAVLPLAVALPLAGQAQNAFVVADSSLRAGPAPEYPDLTVLPYGTWVDVQGCTDGWEWCDVIADDPYGDRGWIPGDYLEYEYEDQPVPVVEYGPRIGIPIVSFSIVTYWDAHYRNRPFYRDRDDWYHRRIVRAAAPPPPPKPPGGWHVPPPPQGGGRHRENPPNPPRAPVNPSHPPGGHQENPIPPHVPVYAPKPAGEPENAPPPPAQHGPPVPRPRPTAGSHTSHPASSTSHGQNPEDKHKQDNNGDDNGH